MRGLKSRGGKVKTKALELKLTTENRAVEVAGLILSHVHLSPQHREGLRDPNPLLQPGPDSHHSLACLHVAIGIIDHLLAQIGLAILMVTLDPYNPN